MAYSTKDELAAIERAVRGSTPMDQVDESPVPEDANGDPRRGSSMFSSGFGMTISSDDTEEDKKYVGDDLLVDFPNSDDESEDEATPPAHRPPTSGMKRGIEDFDDEERETRRELPGAPMPGASLSKPPPETVSVAPATGSQNHRPMVGGFAAAAYEAAREYHYQSRALQQKQQNIPKRTGPPPSI